MSKQAVYRHCTTFAVILAVAAHGCDSATEDAALPPGDGSAAAPDAAPAADPRVEQASPDVQLRVAGEEQLQTLLAQLHGKVVLVDFWATWCAPCVKQFPHTVSLHRELADEGLAVIAVSLDEPESQPKVREFLERHETEFPNLLSQYGGGVEAIEKFGLPGPVPCYRVYDRTGKLRHEFAVDPLAERQFTPEDIESAITGLL